MSEMNVTCGRCATSFVPPNTQKQLMLRAMVAGSGLVMIECPHCFNDINWHPEGERPATLPWRCPVSGCAGWVSELREDGEPAWACGECGSTWRNISNFYKEIADIQGRFPYRATCYTKLGSIWLPGSFPKEIVGYDSLTEAEPKEFGERFERG